MSAGEVGVQILFARETLGVPSAHGVQEALDGAARAQTAAHGQLDTLVATALAGLGAAIRDAKVRAAILRSNYLESIDMFLAAAGDSPGAADATNGCADYGGGVDDLTDMLETLGDLGNEVTAAVRAAIEKLNDFQQHNTLTGLATTDLIQRQQRAVDGMGEYYRVVTGYEAPPL